MNLTNSIKNLLLLAVASTISLVMAEIMAKKLVSKELQYWSVFEHEADAGWKLKSNLVTDVEWYPGKKHTIRTNRMGFRDTPNPDQIPQQNLIISVQGDFNVLGFAMTTEKTMTSHLGEWLDSKSERGFSVINAGVSGFDLQNYVLQLDKIKKAYSPDHTFLIFNMGNDFIGSLLSVTYLIPRPFYDLEANGRLKLNSSPFRVQTQQHKLSYVPSLAAFQNKFDQSFWNKKPRLVLGEIIGNSYLLYFVHSRLASRGYASPKLDNLLKLKYFPDKELKVSDEEYQDALCLRPYGQYSAKMIEYWKLVDQLYIALFSEYRSKFTTGTMPTVILLPSNIEVLDTDHFSNAPSSCGVDNKGAAISFYYSKIKAILNEAGLPYVDLYPQFVNKPDLFLKNNEHLSEKGHELLGKAMYNVLKMKYLR